jgi:TRAP-type C4-dicarboxylate transport system substrate-binding protein
MKMQKFLAPMIVALMVAPALAAQTARLKIATMVPDGSFWMDRFEAAAEEIDRRTDGRVNLRFYPGGTMGSDTAVLRKMRIGQLHGGVLLAGGLATIYQDFDIYSLPLLFRSYDEVDHIRRHMDEKLVAGLEEHGVVAFGISETGFTYLMSVEPTRSFADLRGRKTWTPQDDPIGLAIVQEAGLAPVPLPISDVLTGLQTGLIDTVAAPPVGAIALQWFTKAPYITDLPITYVCGALAMTEKSLARLSAEDRGIVSEVLNETIADLDRKIRADEQAAREALVKQGATYLDPTEETYSEWESIAASATEKLLAERGYDARLFAEIQQLLTDFRASNESAGADE